RMLDVRLRHFSTAFLFCAIALSASAQSAPTFKVEPSWPLEMPNHWIMGAVTGVFVNAKQHVWVTHLPETLTEEELTRCGFCVERTSRSSASSAAAAARPDRCSVRTA